MNKIMTLLTLMILSFSISQAQVKPGIITGDVMDGTSKGLEAASISLLNAKDSAVLKMATSDKKGKFGFDNLQYGDYLLSISAVGYQTSFSKSVAITAANSSVVLTTMTLAARAKDLSSVTIVAKRALIEQKPGKTVMNVEASPTNTGLNALELLQKAPGVSVDNDGNISIRGKQGVLILVDGKPTYMSGADLAALLKTMQANSLDQIEIMTNPPAKYDASGNSGIINIKTKKGLNTGINGNGNLNYGQGIYGQVNGGLNINYRNKKLNIFGGFNGGTYAGFNKMTIDRKFYGRDKITQDGSADQFTRTNYDGNYENVKLGVDYYFSKKDVAGFVVNGNFNRNHRTPVGDSYIRDVTGKTQYKLGSSGNDRQLGANLSSNFNYKHSFDSAGRELTADADYVYYNTKNNLQLNTQSYDADDVKNGNTIVLRGNIPSAINIYSAKIDYVHPFKKALKLETGLKTSFVHTDSKVAYDRNSGAGWSKDDRSNHFVYDENINAAYLIVSKSIRKLELNAGLRLENTVSRGHQLTNDSTFSRNYTNLFPNLGLGFNASKKNQLNFSYSRRVSRPNYGDLNPFVSFIDSLTYSKGNPYLQPQFTNNFELSHTYNRFLTTTLNYTQTNDIITSILKQDNEKRTTYEVRENFSSMKQVGLAVTANIPVKKWWSINVYTNVYKNNYSGLYQNVPVEIGVTSFNGNITNTLVFGKGWNGEISGWYRTRAAEGLLIINSMGALNTGISKQVLKTRGTLKFGVRDILNTQQFSGYAKYSDVNLQIAGRRDSRSVNISFNYRFGKKDIPSARRKTGGSDDEQNRVKSGGN